MQNFLIQDKGSIKDCLIGPQKWSHYGHTHYKNFVKTELCKNI